MFVNRNDENIGVVRPRILQISARTEISDAKIVAAEKSKANFSGEQQVFELINKKRAELGLKSLIWNEDVAKIARIHSEEMADYKFFDHAGHDGSMVNNRADALGLSKWRSIGENIAYNRGFANPVGIRCRRMDEITRAS